MLVRNNNNPIITRNDIPDLGVYTRDVSSVFNPGAIKVNDIYHLMLRVQNRGRETFLMMADGDDARLDALGHENAVHHATDFGFDAHQIPILKPQTLSIFGMHPNGVFMRYFIKPFAVGRSRMD